MRGIREIELGSEVIEIKGKPYRKGIMKTDFNQQRAVWVAEDWSELR